MTTRSSVHPFYLAALLALVLLAGFLACQRAPVRPKAVDLSSAACVPAEPPLSRMGCAP
jgi:hypothetical protein